MHNMKMNSLYPSTTVLILAMAFNIGAGAEKLEGVSEPSVKHYSPALNQTYPDHVYWGDTHLHTSLSWDAYNAGNRLGPDIAYRYAKGETITANDGLPAQINRPLDFLVVADHANNMGVRQGFGVKDPRVLSSDLGRRVFDQIEKLAGMADSDEKKQLSFAIFQAGFLDGNMAEISYHQSIWDSVISLADQHNDPGRFTAFIGYEWTQTFYNLHRVVIFKDDASKAGQVIPFSQYDSSDPEDLWAYLSSYEQQTGGEVLAIPHNGNMSRGVMFALEDVNGNVFSEEYARMRSRWEPLYEVVQTKGDGETHPVVSPNDEFADYERNSFAPLKADSWQEATKKKRGLTHYNHWEKINNEKFDYGWQRQYEYARPALKFGLREQARLGVNPFKFGMIGSTDNHQTLAAADENNYRKVDPSPERSTTEYKPATFTAGSWENNAAGYAAIWAKENTRESLFAAMKRKEVYASTGPRMTVRFFGGWDYQSDDAFSSEFAKIGYQKGVPMGGDLSNAPENKAPQFLIRAVKDPDGANLDRVQVIKGWHDAKGELHEKIYNVALSDNRKPNWRGKIKPVGNTVDIKNASYTNTIGDAELATVWTDPDFNKDELAFYYVRVLEIPTPRWTAYDAKFFNLKDIPEEVPMVTQERAYTSPIWYSPKES